MKILIFADLHMCPRASIINKWGNNYPMRLENCISTVNWIEQLAVQYNCEGIINLGDFFDKPDLSSETITALKEINWSNITHYNLVGNHDASDNSLEFNSVNSLNNTQHKIITEPQTIILDDCEICFLPYVTDSDRKPLADYFGPRTSNRRIILSHNDIAGIQFGPITSKTGFTIEEIEANCDLMCNGHLHNGQAISSKIINVGNCSGKDFSEDAFKHTHGVFLLDTTTFSLDFIENPFAFNFYKIEINELADVSILDILKPNAVCSIKCDSELIEQTKEKLKNLDSQIIESRLIITKKYTKASETIDELDLSVDHLARFIECCKTNIENTAILDEELSEICK